MAATNWAGLYRERETLAKVRLAELFADRRGSSDRALSSDAAAVYRRRLARASAGIAGTIGGVAMLGVSALSWETDMPELNPKIWLAALATTLLTYALSRLEAQSRLRRGVRALVGLTDDVDRDLSRLEGAAPLSYVRDCAESLGRLSIAAPLMAVALLGPLTLHWVFFGNLGNSFGEWMAFSAVIVGHAHLMLAFLSWRFAGRLMEGTVRSPVSAGLKVLGWTVVTAAVPGILFLAMPPVITFVTGLFVVLPTYLWAFSTASRERALIFMPT